jgi:plasmid maintenance system antidote protein VapI
MSKSFQPNWISPPGNSIVDILSEQQIPISLFAKRMNFTIHQANNLIKGDFNITLNTETQSLIL